VHLYIGRRTWRELWGYEMNTHLRSTVQSTLSALRRLRRLRAYQVLRLLGNAEAMTRLYLLVRFLALLQPLIFGPYTVHADPKVDQCLALGTISEIANCLDAFRVGHSSLS